MVNVTASVQFKYEANVGIHDELIENLLPK